MKRPLKNRVRLSLSALVIVAVLLVLQLFLIPMPGHDSPAAVSAHSLAGAPVTSPSPEIETGPPLWRRVAIALGLLLLGGTAAVWWYLERRMFTPLADMTGVVAAMSEGHLDQTLDTAAGTELEHLADLINTFSVNQQEGLLFTWNQAGSSLKCLQNLEKYAQKAKCASTDPQGPALAAILREVQQTRSYLNDIQDLVRTYYLYDVCLEDQKALAAEDADAHVIA